ncbi:MAG: GldG family protein [Bacteroidota bacterium]
MSNAFEGFLANRKESVIQILLIVGSLVMLNYLADQLIVRFDLTEDNRYTLSEASEQIAEQVNDPITVTAYFSADLPPQLAQTEEEFRNFLEEFRAYSGNNLEYEFVNPNESEEMEQQAQQAGIRPVSIDVRERDQISQRRAYLGAKFQYGEKSEVLPIIRPGAAMEYSIASTVKKLTIDQKPKIGLLQGHGEPSRQAMTQVTQELNQLYRIEEVSGLDTAAVPADVEVLMVVAPQQQLSGTELSAIDQYIMRGGKVVFALNRVETDVQRGQANVLDTGIEKLLASYRIPVNADLVRDVNATTIQVQQQQGGFRMVNSVRYPYIPQVTTFADHPATQGLEAVIMQFVSSLDVTMADTTQQITILAESSNQSGLARGRFDLNPMKDWTQNDFNAGSQPLGAAITGTFRSAFADVDSVDVPLDRSQETSLIVFGDGDFIINGEGQQQQGLPEDNINLMVNSVDFLADDTGLIALRTKGVTSRPLEQIEDGTKTLLKYLNLLAPILIVLGYGGYRYRRRQARRRKWITEGV